MCNDKEVYAFAIFRIVLDLIVDNVIFFNAQPFAWMDTDINDNGDDP